MDTDKSRLAPLAPWRPHHAFHFFKKRFCVRRLAGKASRAPLYTHMRRPETTPPARMYHAKDFVAKCVVLLSSNYQELQLKMRNTSY